MQTNSQSLTAFSLIVLGTNVFFFGRTPGTGINVQSRALPQPEGEKRCHMGFTLRKGRRPKKKVI